VKCVDGCDEPWNQPKRLPTVERKLMAAESEESEFVKRRDVYEGR
jgi:hypothetical protein